MESVFVDILGLPNLALERVFLVIKLWLGRSEVERCTSRGEGRCCKASAASGSKWWERRACLVA